MGDAGGKFSERRHFFGLKELSLGCGQLGSGFFHPFPKLAAEIFQLFIHQGIFQGQGCLVGKNHQGLKFFIRDQRLADHVIGGNPSQDLIPGKEGYGGKGLHVQEVDQIPVHPRVPAGVFYKEGALFHNRPGDHVVFPVIG